MSKDPYKILGVARGASEAEIKKAYRQRAKALHPDLHPNDEAKAEEFKRVSSAFDILSDTKKKTRFDRGEIDGDGNERGFQGGGGGFPGGGFGQHQGGAHGDPFEDVLSGIFGGGRRRNTGPRKGRDVRYRVDISFVDAVMGARRRMSMSDNRSLDVNIPAGLVTGQTLRLKSQGESSPYGGPPGDALLEVTILESETWTRDGDNLRMNVAVSLEIAVLGGTVEVPTPTGPVSLKVPEGSNTGAVLRLRGKGVQRKGKQGNLYAKLEITLDDPKDSKLKAFLKKR